MKEIRPQPGPQTKLLECDADICIYGGAAGGGKTFGLLLDALKYPYLKMAASGGASFFRRTTTQITNQGGLWDTATELYRKAGGKPREKPNLDITFRHPIYPYRKGFDVKFSHLQHANSVYDYQGSQIPILYFDELTHFTESMVFYMLSRNRSNCGIRPYTRASTNPDASSWVRKFIDWWIGCDGFAIPERSGVVRWFCRFEEEFFWFNSKEDAKKKFPQIPPTSFTFIPSKLSDNKILMENDPGYMARLMSLSRVERERLKDGNWDVMPSAGKYFKRFYFEEVDQCPPLKQIVRCWDRAATEWHPGDEGDPDYTAGIKLGQTFDDRYIILDIEHERISAGAVDRLILNTARQDGIGVTVKGFQDPGAAGKAEIDNFYKILVGFSVTHEVVTKNKVTQAKPCSSHAEHAGMMILKSCKHREYFYQELENFPEFNHDDLVDSLSGGFNYLNKGNVGQFTDAFL